MTAKSSSAGAKETGAQQAKTEAKTEANPNSPEAIAEQGQAAEQRQAEEQDKSEKRGKAGAKEAVDDSKLSTGSTAEEQRIYKGQKAADEGEQVSPTLATSNPLAPDTSHGDKLSEEANRETAEAGTAALIDVEDVAKLTFQTKQFDTSSPVAMDTHEALAYPELLDGTQELPKEGTQPQEEGEGDKADAAEPARHEDAGTTSKEQVESGDKGTSGASAADPSQPSPQGTKKDTSGADKA